MTLRERRIGIQHATHVNLRHPFRAHITKCMTISSRGVPARWHKESYGKGDRRPRAFACSLGYDWLFPRHHIRQALLHAYGRTGPVCTNLNQFNENPHHYARTRPSN